MRPTQLVRTIIIIAGLVIFSCVEPYLPPVIENNPNYLVVNGMLNLNGTAEIQLTYTTNITSTDAPPRAANALVQIQDDANNTYTLPEISSGYYTQSNLSLDVLKKYRLYIKTSSGKEYLSDFVELKQTPPIDSISYALNPTQDGLNINVNTHDFSGNSQFYRWKFTETWEYNARYFSYYKMIDDVIIPRTSDEFINTCWKTEPYTQIVIGATNRLAEDLVSNFTLTTIPQGSDKISKKYSILVQQVTLTEPAYNYWLTLKKVTEEVGGLFDPLPAQILGNIYCTSHPAEKSIGFFSATSVEEMRVFITPDQLPEGYLKYSPEPCTIDTVFFEPMVIYGSIEEIILRITGGFITSAPHCVDCRAKGGVLNKPDFWE
jgi:hypothetical protein